MLEDRCRNNTCIIGSRTSEHRNTHCRGASAAWWSCHSLDNCQDEDECDHNRTSPQQTIGVHKAEAEVDEAKYPHRKTSVKNSDELTNREKE